MVRRFPPLYSRRTSRLAMDSHSVQTEPLSRLGRIFTGLAALVAIGGTVLLIGVLLYNRFHHVAAAVEGPAVQLLPGSNDILDVAPEVRTALGVFTAPVKKAGSRDRLELLGSLFIDPTHMVRVRSRFGGEVVSIGPGEAGKANDPQPLRVGDRVKQGQLLAVIWSKDLGETKSDLVDALSQLAQHERQYKKLQSLDKGLVSQKDVQDAQRMREADLIKVETLERTLRSWKLPQAEIDEAHVEAEKIHQGKPNDIAAEQHWAEVEVRSPQDGVILERSITLGEFVTTDADMFKIADVSTLGVLVQVCRCMKTTCPI
jgi:cobalt-zinc-cadmium efflux system membrane fusion protein